MNLTDTSLDRCRYTKLLGVELLELLCIRKSRVRMPRDRNYDLRVPQFPSVNHQFIILSRPEHFNV
jgi:hypothetical protein